MLPVLWIVIFELPVVFGSTTSNGAVWRRLVKGSFTVNCHKQDIACGREVIDIAGEAYSKIAGDIGWIDQHPIAFVIASSDREFDRLTGGRIPEWGIAAASPAESVVYLKSIRFAKSENDFHQVLIHEMSHVVLGMAVGRREIDRWFEEGFALLQSGEMNWGNKIRLARSLVTDSYIPLREIDEVLNFRRDRAALAYQESFSAVNYLVERFGRQILSELIEKFRRGYSMNRALERTANLTFDAFESEWLDEMESRYKWVALLDFPMILSVCLVILFAAAYVGTRIRVQRKKQMWEQDGFENI